jgi:hypothetical protein
MAAPAADALDAHVELLYHEKQRSALCGVHALNTLLQARAHGAVVSGLRTPAACAARAAARRRCRPQCELTLCRAVRL